MNPPNLTVFMVDVDRANICQKLDIHGSHALMKFALENKELLSK